jgi:hypothetical protein
MYAWPRTAVTRRAVNRGARVAGGSDLTGVGAT